MSGRRLPVACVIVDFLLSERQERRLTPDEERRVDTHLADCPGCRERMRAFEVMRPAMMRAMQRAESVVPSKPTAPPRRFPCGRVSAVLAACAVVAVSIWWMLGQFGSRHDPSRDVSRDRSPNDATGVARSVPAPSTIDTRALVSRAMLDGVTARDPDAMQRVAASLDPERAAPTVRRAAAALVATPELAVPPVELIAKCFDDTDRDVRRIAARRLAAIDLPPALRADVVASALRRVRDRDMPAQDRVLAVHVLRHHAALPTIQAIARLLVDPAAPQPVRVAIAEAVGRLGSDAVPIIEAALDSTAAEAVSVRAALLVAYGRCAPRVDRLVREIERQSNGRVLDRAALGLQLALDRGVPVPASLAGVAIERSRSVSGPAISRLLALASRLAGRDSFDGLVAEFERSTEARRRGWLIRQINKLEHAGVPDFLRAQLTSDDPDIVTASAAGLSRSPATAPASLIALRDVASRWRARREREPERTAVARCDRAITRARFVLSGGTETATRLSAWLRGEDGADAVAAMEAFRRADVAGLIRRVRSLPIARRYAIARRLLMQPMREADRALVRAWRREETSPPLRAVLAFAALPVPRPAVDEAMQTLVAPASANVLRRLAQRLGCVDERTLALRFTPAARPLPEGWRMMVINALPQRLPE